MKITKNSNVLKVSELSSRIGPCSFIFFYRALHKFFVSDIIEGAETEESKKGATKPTKEDNITFKGIYQQQTIASVNDILTI